MAERSIYRVRIALSEETMELRWKTREALLAELRPIESMREVVLAFEAVGTSRAVELTAEQKALYAALGGWAQETDGGYTALPEGILELSTGLQDELQDGS